MAFTKKTEKQAAEKIKYLETKIAFLESNAQMSREAEKQVRAIRHDLKNHLIALDYLCAKGDRERYEKYSRKLTDLLSLPFNGCFTGNAAADAVISVKKREAEEMGISFEITSRGKTDKPLSADDITLVSVFGSVMDMLIASAEKGGVITVIFTEISAGLGFGFSCPCALVPDKRELDFIDSQLGEYGFCVFSCDNGILEINGGINGS